VSWRRGEEATEKLREIKKIKKGKARGLGQSAATYLEKQKMWGIM